MSKAMELADKLELMERSGLWYASKDAAAELRRLAAVEEELAAIRALEPVAYVIISANDFDLGLTDDYAFGKKRLPDGRHNLYALPEQK